MNTVAITEYLSAAFVGIALWGQRDKRDNVSGDKWLRFCVLAMFLYLLVDASAYTFVGPDYPLAFRYVINLLSYTGGAIVLILFTAYCEAYISERTTLNHWVFRVPRIMLYVVLAAIAGHFIAGDLVVYQNGIETAVNSFPTYIRVINLIPMIYNPIVIILERKHLEPRAVLLLGLFDIAPIIASVSAFYTGVDIGTVFGAFSLVLVSTLLQKGQIREELGKVSTMQALSNGLAREYHTVWLMDGFGDHNLHLYRSTGTATVKSAVQLGLDQPCFDTSVVKYIRDNVVEEDQERVIEETRFETIERETPEEGTYVVSYRRYTADRSDYTYHQMCFARAAVADGTINYILAYRDADKMMREQIDQQKQLEEALSRANEESVRRKMVYQLSGSSQWSYEISADDQVLSVNYSDRLLETVNARPSGNAMGWVNLVHPEDKERVLAGFMAAICDHTGNTSYDESYRLFDVDGKCRWVRSVGRVIRRPDGTGDFIGMATDYTAQFEAQEKQQEQLEKALSMADVANKAKTDFLFNMSHDIRTPMNAIIGFTNIAKKEIDNKERVLDSLEKVQTSSDILLNLINDVLDMSRIESGKVELHEEKYEIIEAFDSFEAAMSSLADSKNIKMKFLIGEVRDRYIFVDGPRFDRVLINIISNAIKYTPANGFVNVFAEQIEDTKPGYGNYRFTVTDSGIGMSEEFQKHMFEDFTREENSTTSGVQGTGLGLSLAKKLVDMMGGTISCVSKQGIGTTFTIVFPFRLQTEADMAEIAEIPQKYAEIDLKGKRVLLVEDNELNREIANEILSNEGLIVDMAENGQMAVNLVRSHISAYYDFILMDIQMPIMDGYEATKAIHKLVPDLKAPIIALSANAFAEDKKKSLEAGMDDHIAKPINIKELFGVLAKHIN